MFHTVAYCVVPRCVVLYFVVLCCYELYGIVLDWIPLYSMVFFCAGGPGTTSQKNGPGRERRPDEWTPLAAAAGRVRSLEATRGYLHRSAIAPANLCCRRRGGGRSAGQPGKPAGWMSKTPQRPRFSAAGGL